MERFIKYSFGLYKYINREQEEHVGLSSKLVILLGFPLDVVCSVFHLLFTSFVCPQLLPGITSKLFLQLFKQNPINAFLIN